MNSNLIPLTYGIVGVSEWGPTKPTIITSISDLLDLYGLHTENSTIHNMAIRIFRETNSNMVYIRRILPTTATKAICVLWQKNVHAIQIEAKYAGRFGNDIYCRITEPSNDEPGYFNMDICDANSYGTTGEIIERFRNINNDSSSVEYGIKLINENSIYITAHQLTNGINPDIATTYLFDGASDIDSIQESDYIAAEKQLESNNNIDHVIVCST
jgi:hypothetical protein